MGIECLNMRAFAYLREIFDSKHTKPILSTFSLSHTHSQTRIHSLSVPTHIFEFFKLYRLMYHVFHFG